MRRSAWVALSLGLAAGLLGLGFWPRAEAQIPEPNRFGAFRIESTVLEDNASLFGPLVPVANGAPQPHIYKSHQVYSYLGPQCNRQVTTNLKLGQHLPAGIGALPAAQTISFPAVTFPNNNSAFLTANPLLPVAGSNVATSAIRFQLGGEQTVTNRDNPQCQFLSLESSGFIHLAATYTVRNVSNAPATLHWGINADVVVVHSGTGTVGSFAYSLLKSGVPLFQEVRNGKERDVIIGAGPINFSERRRGSIATRVPAGGRVTLTLRFEATANAAFNVQNGKIVMTGTAAGAQEHGIRVLVSDAAIPQ